MINRQAVIRKFGNLDVVIIEEGPLRLPGKGEVRIRIEASTDVFVCK